MKFKSQSKHKLLKTFKHFAQIIVGALIKSFFYLATPPLCPSDQLTLYFVLYEFLKFVCPLRIFHDIEEMEPQRDLTRKDIWYEI
ncbi:hypothetical protein ACLKA6_014064 [Drosophila palustris]